MTIKSEAFKNTYAIFVNSKCIPVYKEIISRNNFEETDIFKATFDESTAMIVMPVSDKTKEVEQVLFEQSKEGQGEGFWGQVGVGYKGKSWMKV
jgi:hypothetical protein